MIKGVLFFVLCILSVIKSIDGVPIADSIKAVSSIVAITKVIESSIIQRAEEGGSNEHSAHSTQPPSSPSPSHAATSSPTHPPTGSPTSSPTHAATSPPSSGCSGTMKMLVPLYVYPGSEWDTVIAGASSVPTVAIINPNSGPGGAPDSSYTSYMNKMSSNDVEMIGYVHTSYGTRSINDVKADINTYATSWPHLVGIFVDEASASSSNLSYYQSLYSYIISLPGYQYVVINPGAVPDSAYSNVATQIVVFEDVASKVANFNGEWLNCANSNQYAAIVHDASGTSTMESSISTLDNKGYFGWVYVTDGSGASAYDNLASYYSSEVSFVDSSN